MSPQSHQIDENLKSYNGKMISASEYFYGCSYDVWDDMKYPEAILDRKSRAYDLYKKLYQESLGIPMNKEVPVELATRIRKTKKAFDDNAKLAEEKYLIL